MGNPRRNKKKTALNGPGLNLKPITPKTANQQVFFDNYASGNSQILLGYPGTGKTMLALYKALEELGDASSEYNKIAIVRSPVPTREIGHLPGSVAEKVEIYEMPYRLLCTELFGRGDAYEILKKHGTIEFLPSSHLRGITLDRTIIIADEIQNFTAHEADTLLTRGSSLSKSIICGDVLQRDLTKHAEKDIEKFLKVITEMPEDFDIVQFGLWDIVRGGLVGNYIRKKYSLFPDGF
jgi:phosphate starvation-inducible protein PhoH